MSWFFNWLAGLFRVRVTNSETVVQIQALTVRFCRFLPTVETVLALMSVNPVISTAAVFARKICQAVTASASVPTLMGTEKPKPMVDGVVIEGEWIIPKEK